MIKYFCPWRAFLVPAVLMALAVVCLSTRTGWFVGQGRPFPIHDVRAAYVQALMLITWAAGLHLRHGWRNIPRFAAPADRLGMACYIAAAGLAICLLYLLVRYAMG
jgi:hypothetical protein